MPLIPTQGSPTCECCPDKPSHLATKKCPECAMFYCNEQAAKAEETNYCFGCGFDLKKKSA